MTAFPNLADFQSFGRDAVVGASSGVGRLWEGVLFRTM